MQMGETLDQGDDLTERDWDYDGWEKEEATDFDDYLDGLGPDRVEVRFKDGSVTYWSMARLRRVLGLLPED